MFLNLKSQYGNRRTSGFTLLELLLVVGIMSVLAFSAISLTDTMDSSQDQYRYERARSNAIELSQGFVKKNQGELIVTGFVADLGVLPANMAELAFGVEDKATKDTLFPESGVVYPTFDLTTDMNAGFLNGIDAFDFTPDDPTLDPLNPSLKMIKGFRGSKVQNEAEDPDDNLADYFYIGTYLNLRPGKNLYTGSGKPRFSNGWDVEGGSFDSTFVFPTTNPLSLDDMTHGWVWEYNLDKDGDGTRDGDLDIRSYGKDGLKNVSPVNDYSEDLLLASVKPDDWSVSSLEVHAELTNDLFNESVDCSGVRPYLLIYDGRARGWRTLPAYSGFGVIPQGKSSQSSFVLGMRVPVGSHILLLAGENLQNIPNTPLAFSHEVQRGGVNPAQPEIQRLMFASDSFLMPFKLKVTLPNPNDSNALITWENEDYHAVDQDPSVAWDDTLSLLLNEFVSRLNEKFQDGNEPAFYDDAAPLTFYSEDHTIKINEAAASSSITTNSDLLSIEILFEPGFGPIRARRVSIYPGQTNILRINLSSLAQ